MGWNLAPSEGNYDLYTQLPDHLWLRGSDGQYCTVNRNATGEKWRIFDLSQPEMVTRCDLSPLWPRFASNFVTILVIFVTVLARLRDLSCVAFRQVARCDGAEATGVGGNRRHLRSAKTALMTCFLECFALF